MYLLQRKGTYYVEFFDPRENRRKRISTKTKNRAEALKFISELKDNLSNPTKIEFISLGKFKDIYLDYIHNIRSPKHYRCVKMSFTKLIANIGENTLLSSIKVRDLEKFFMLTFQSARYAAHLYHRNLKAAFNKAIQWEYLSANAVKAIKLPKIPKSFPVFITKKELDEIMKKTENTKLQQLYVFAFYTGLRLAEITNLQWSSVNLKEMIITVKNTETFTTKSKKERIIPICKPLQETLTLMKSQSNSKEFLFTKEDGFRFNEDYVSKQFKKAVIAASLNSKIHFHTLRHSFASNLVQKGVSLFLIKELLGHEDLSTTQIYSHLQSKNLFDAVNKLDN